MSWKIKTGFAPQSSHATQRNYTSQTVCFQCAKFWPPRSQWPDSQWFQCDQNSAQWTVNTNIPAPRCLHKNLLKPRTKNAAKLLHKYGKFHWLFLYIFCPLPPRIPNTFNPLQVPGSITVTKLFPRQHFSNNGQDSWKYSEDGKTFLAVL